MPARLASAVWVSPEASRRALIRSAKAALRGGTIKFSGFPLATSINVLQSPVCWLLPAPCGGVLAEGRGALALGHGWSRQWTTRWKFEGGPVVCPVRDLASMPVRGALPVRRFSWWTSQFHRPGLQYLVSTGRHHGFESHVAVAVIDVRHAWRVRWPEFATPRRGIRCGLPWCGRRLRG